MRVLCFGPAPGRRYAVGNRSLHEGGTPGTAQARWHGGGTDYRAPESEGKIWIYERRNFKLLRWIIPLWIPLFSHFWENSENWENSEKSVLYPWLWLWLRLIINNNCCFWFWSFACSISSHFWFFYIHHLLILLCLLLSGFFFLGCWLCHVTYI